MTDDRKPNYYPQTARQTPDLILFFNGIGGNSI